MDHSLQRIFDRLVLAATILAVCVVALGAYVRLSDAGLGCPDWPGCYGHLSVPHTDIAQQVFPNRPLEPHKAWKEMVHRYLAGILGMLILAIFTIAWRVKRSMAVSPVLPTFLLGLVVFQALLGMWTVTLLLKPVIVSAHLMGGMSTLGLLVWMSERRWGGQIFIRAEVVRKIKPWALGGLLVLACQIMLGGWTSSNYAALACTDFPLCQGAWLPPMDFAHAFHLVRELGINADGSKLPLAALTAIHWTHRLGALLTFFYLGGLSVKLLRTSAWNMLGVMLGGALLLQLTLGISNVVFSLPLPVAVSHNAGAALLLILLVLINSRIARASGVGGLKS